MRTALLVLTCVAVAACVNPTGSPDGDDGAGDTDLVRADGKADGDLRARVTGMTVWVDPVVSRAALGESVLWTVSGNTSTPLESVFAFVPDDAFGEAVLTGERDFEANLNGGHEVNTMLSGLPLFVRLVPEGGGTDNVFAGLWYEPAVTGFSGSSKVWVAPELATVWYGGSVVYRARVNVTSSGYDRIEVVAGDPAARPVVVSEGTRRWRLDFSYDALAAAAADPQGITIEAWRGGNVMRKRVRLAARIGWLGLTRKDPYEVWGRECDESVRECLSDMEVGELDAEHCGSYREVQKCGGAAVAAEPARAAIVADVRDQLVRHYEWRGADIEAAGGRSLADAQAAVTEASVVRITEAADDPLGHDLDWTYVYRVPDTTIPGSSAYFFALYDRRGGALATVYYHDPS